MDFFTDYFTAEELIASVAKAPYIPGRLAPLFDTRRLAGTKLAMEDQALNDAELLTPTPRGTPSKAEVLERRAVHTFETSHYRVQGAVYADEVLNSRAVGVTAARESISNRRDEVVTKMRRDIDLTHEALRAITVNAPSNAFGAAPAPSVISFGPTDSSIRDAVFNKIIKPMEDALKGIPSGQLLALCHDDFWSKLLESKSLRETFLNQQAANSLRGSTTEQMVFGNVIWERYRGVGSVNIEAGKAKIIPTGVSELFVQAFAPADTMDQVGAGALGGPYYVNAYPIDDGNRGIAMEMQTNIVTVCTRPQAVLTIALA